MINEEYIHCNLVDGLDSVLRALPDVASLPFRPDAMRASVTTMALGQFLGVEGDTLGRLLNGVGSIYSVMVRVDRHSLLRALDDPTEFICGAWPTVSVHRRQIRTRAVACRASLLHRLGLLRVPQGVERDAIPTVSVGEAFGSYEAADVLIDGISRLYWPSREPDLGTLSNSIDLWLAQQIPADLLAAYWDRHREHFLVAQFGPGPVRDLVMADRLDGLVFGPGEVYQRYLHGFGTATTRSRGSLAHAASLVSNAATGLVSGVQPTTPKKISVLLRPTRTVFGQRVQVESDGREIFVKPVSDDGK